MDESTADDGAIFRFWAFIERLRLAHDPRPFVVDLEDVARVREAIDAFELEDAAP